MGTIELAPKVTSPDTRFQKSRKQPFIESESLFDRLTSREKAVLALMAQGLSNNKIGNDLCITERTAERHINKIFRKLKIDHNNGEKDSRVEAVNLYINQDPDFQNPFDGHRINESFSSRQKEVLCLVSQGLSNPTIAREMSLKRTTVEGHINHILSVLEVDNVNQNTRIVMALVSKAKT